MNKNAMSRWRQGSTAAVAFVMYDNLRNIHTRNERNNKNTRSPLKRNQLYGNVKWAA
jgi:hypothetical protein